jgi:predicted nucleic acid-binding protein
MTIALDSNIFIYFFNENPEFVEAARRLMLSIQSGEVRGVASVLAISEIMRKGNDDLYQALISIRNLRFVGTDEAIALRAAGLQRQYDSLRLVDALHLATAEACGAGTFWTNDRALLSLTIKDLKIQPIQ